MALDRALTLYGDRRHGQAGAFPEFYFFDCHSCHRRDLRRSQCAR